MAVDPHDDIRLLNALVDGELSSADHAAAAARLATDRDFARAYATLARLKACVAESAEAAPTVALPTPTARTSWRLLGLGLSTAAAALVAAFVLVEVLANRDLDSTAAPPAALTVAAVGYAALVPDLSPAGLALIGIETETVGASPVIVASYRGPRGCRLDMRVRAVDATEPMAAAAGRRAWVAGDLAYELAAFGMPAERFEAVARAAILLTRAGQSPERPDLLLREARAVKSPCLG